MYPKEENLSNYIKKAKKIEKIEHQKRIKIAILSNFTITGLAESIRVKCHKINVDCSSYVSGYNQYNQEILNLESKLHQFKPEITFLVIDSKNLFKGNYDIFHTKSIE